MPGNEDRPENLFEALLYAPLGAAAMAREALSDLPELIGQLGARGRKEVEQTSAAVQNQLSLATTLARAAGRQVLRLVGLGEEPRDEEPEPWEPRVPAAEVPATPPGEGESAIRRAQSQVGRTLQVVDGKRGRAGAPRAAGSAAAEAVAVGGREALAANHRATVAEALAEAELLAISDYESLSAAQVNARLGALTPGELAAVRAYEETHRGRRTVLARIEALTDQ